MPSLGASLQAFVSELGERENLLPLTFKTLNIEDGKWDLQRLRCYQISILGRER